VEATLDHAARTVRSAAPTVGPVRLVLVDGPAGSGKTTIAAALAGRLDDAPVVHADELYEGWSVVAGAPDRPTAFARLAARVESWLLEPWTREEPGAHPVWDWAVGSWHEHPRTVPGAPVVILEGVGMAAGALRARAVLSVWVEHPDPAERLSRVLARDGAGLRAEMARWQRDEAAWFERDATASGCSLVVRT
jgi:uridine kinase